MMPPNLFMNIVLFTLLISLLSLSVMSYSATSPTYNVTLSLTDYEGAYISNSTTYSLNADLVPQPVGNRRTIDSYYICLTDYCVYISADEVNIVQVSAGGGASGNPSLTMEAKCAYNNGTWVYIDQVNNIGFCEYPQEKSLETPNFNWIILTLITIAASIHSMNKIKEELKEEEPKEEKQSKKQSEEEEQT